jgi:hypothetical protein
MGSTLETAIVITAVIFVLTLFIIIPADVCIDCKTVTDTAIEDIGDGAEGISSEQLNTLLTGLSENYRMIYGGALDALSEEE